MRDTRWNRVKLRDGKLRIEKTQSISIIDHFASVDDPRMKRTVKRKLGDVIAGADSRGDIETFGSAKIVRFETFIELPNGIPSHDTFGRVFSLIDARRFQDLFVEWTKRVLETTQRQQGNRILSILAYLTQLNIAKIDNSLGNSEFIG